MATPAFRMTMSRVAHDPALVAVVVVVAAETTAAAVAEIVSVRLQGARAGAVRRNNEPPRIRSR